MDEMVGAVGLPAEFQKYRSFVFDCDGVLLDSNGVKTEAFRRAFLPYGVDKAKIMVDYHVTHGGVSRFKKIDYFFHSILKRAPDDGEVDALLDRFVDATQEGLLTCGETSDLDAVMNVLPAECPRMVVSGGMQSELREVFDERGIAKHFIAIYGSPDMKEEILERELASGALTLPALYIGDSKYDYIAANACGLDFAFVYGWTEFRGWEDFFEDKNVLIAENLSSLFKVV